MANLAQQLPELISLEELDRRHILRVVEHCHGNRTNAAQVPENDRKTLYRKLETAVVPLYLQAPEKWAHLMRTTLAFNGSYFNTNRMVKQYTRNAYYPLKLVENPNVEEPVYVEAQQMSNR